MHRPYTRGQNPDPNSRVTAKITTIAMGTPTPYAAYRVGRHGKVNPGTPNQRASTRRNASSVLTCMGQPPGAGDVVTAGADGGAGGDVACRPSRLSNHFPMPNPNEESRPMATTARDAATRPMVSITLDVSPLRDAPSRPRPMMSMINGSALSFSQPLIPSLDTVTSARYRVPATTFRIAVLVITGALPPWAGAYASDTGDVPRVESQTDLVRVAAHRYVAELECQHNGGAAFPSPSSNARGRGPDHSGTWIKVGVTMPVSLHQRILGAARFADDTDLVPGVTSANRLVATALDSFLTELEREHNHGRPFKDPRRRLPGGRTPSR